MKNKKAHTEVGSMLGDRNAQMKDFDVYETPRKIGSLTTTSLKRLPKELTQSNYSAFFNPKIISGKQTFASPFGSKALSQE